MEYNYNVAVFGYCELQALLRLESPIAYNSGVYGWNCDYYEISPTTVICTGYRPHGKRYLPYGTSERYEKKADSIWSDYNRPYDEREQEVKKLFADFCNELKTAIAKSRK